MTTEVATTPLYKLEFKNKIISSIGTINRLVYERQGSSDELDRHDYYDDRLK